jgi:ABC-type hemin transport system ATPase subunit
MVAHERALAERYANRIVTMADGRIISQESTADPLTPRGPVTEQQRGTRP